MFVLYVVDFENVLNVLYIFFFKKKHKKIITRKVQNAFMKHINYFVFRYIFICLFFRMARIESSALYSCKQQLIRSACTQAQSDLHLR